MEEKDKVPSYLTGLFESPSFQKAVDAVGEDRPHWPHPCSGCTFIGWYETSTPVADLAQFHGGHSQMFDLYAHGDEALTARYGPEIRDYFIVNIPEAEEHRFEAPTHPIIEALRRWKEKKANG